MTFVQLFVTHLNHKIQVLYNINFNSSPDLTICWFQYTYIKYLINNYSIKSIFLVIPDESYLSTMALNGPFENRTHHVGLYWLKRYRNFGLRWC